MKTDDELEALLFEFEDAVWCSRGDNAAQNEAAKLRATKAKKALSAHFQAKELEGLQNFRGWIDRNHYQPVNESDRWCLAAGEILLELDNRILQQSKNGES